MRIYLVDNGSLRPESWANLSRVALILSQRLGVNVEPVSVLHSTRIDPDLIPAHCPPTMTWERATQAALAEGERTFLILPFFFGPTGAIIDYLPERKAKIVEKQGDFELHIAPFLGDCVPGERGGLVDLLADQTRALGTAKGLNNAPVILVDHGSPKKDVAALRDSLGESLAVILKDAAESVSVASMERREGPAYAFNEPLLERALIEPTLPASDVIIALLFLSPGRHAGPGGDIATICAEAEAARPGLRAHMADLVGQHEGIVDLLEARYHAALEAMTSD
tara:strand:+ start:16485 stop:17327 length:843 start_codon:yes stop_codon:yes gene_type:complete